MSNVIRAGLAKLRALAADLGGQLIGFDWSVIPTATKNIAWAIRTAGRGINVLRYVPPVHWLGIFAGTSGYDATSAIQSAINDASNSHQRRVYLTAGLWNFTRLYLVYDAVNNPGFNIDRNAEVILEGDGIRPEVTGTTDRSGTILKSSVTSGDALIVSNFADDASPWRSREFEMHNITVMASTPGYAVVCGGVIIPRFNTVNIINDHVNGSGLYISTAFFATLEKLSVKNHAPGTKTGAAIKFETTLFAGLFTLRDVNINGFAYGLDKGNGGWQNLSIYDSEIAADIDAIRIGAGTLDVLNIQGGYFEGACARFLNVVPENGLNALNIGGGTWMLCGALTDKALELKKMNAVNIGVVHTVNLYRPFWELDGAISGFNGGAFAVDGLTFQYSVNPSTPVTYFTGTLPAFYGVDYPASNPNCILHDAAARPIKVRHSALLGDSFAAAHIFETLTKNLGAVSGSSVDLGGAFPIPSFTTAYNITSPTPHHLPPASIGLPHGYAITVTNDVASTQTFPVKTAVADGGATLANMAPGAQRRFVFFNDGVTTGWK